MSIIVGITKENIREDRDNLKQILKELVEKGYVRQIVANDEDLTLQTFTKQENPIMPAYIVDRLTKEK